MLNDIVSTFPFDAEEFVQDQQEGEYFTFPLHASSIGRKTPRKALCRYLALMDRAALGYLPSHLQDEVWNRLRKASRKIAEMQEQGATPQNIHEALANNDTMLEAANVFVRYGFVKPQITMSKAEHNPAAGVVHIEWVKPQDRIAFMVACNDPSSEEFARFERFRPGPDDAVSDREGGEVVSDAAERPAGDAPQPVQFGAAVHG